MTTLQEIKKEKEERVSKILKDAKVFWAFSDEQFHKNKTELQEGEKYVSIGAGGYMPKSCVKIFNDGFDEMNKWYKAEIKKSKNEDAEILYELRNHECFYTNDIEDAMRVLGDRYTEKRVWQIFNKYKKAEQANIC